MGLLQAWYIGLTVTVDSVWPYFMACYDLFTILLACFQPCYCYEPDTYFIFNRLTLVYCQPIFDLFSV
jgi:hypothetical protein